MGSCDGRVTEVCVTCGFVFVKVAGAADRVRRNTKHKRGLSQKQLPSTTFDVTSKKKTHHLLFFLRGRGARARAEDVYGIERHSVSGRHTHERRHTHLDDEGLALVGDGLAHVGGDGVEASVGSGLDALVALRVTVPLSGGERELARGAFGLFPVRLDPALRPLVCCRFAWRGGGGESTRCSCRKSGASFGASCTRDRTADAEEAARSSFFFIFYGGSEKQTTRRKELKKNRHQAIGERSRLFFERWRRRDAPSNFSSK